MSKLPIEYVPSTGELDLPPKFRWVQRIDTFGGEGVSEHFEEVGASLQGALIALIDEAKRLQRVNVEFHLKNQELILLLMAAQDKVATLESRLGCEVEDSRNATTQAQRQRPQPARPPAKPK